MTTACNLLVSRHLCFSKVRLECLCLAPRLCLSELQEHIAAGLPKRVRHSLQPREALPALYVEPDRNVKAPRHFA